MAEPSRDPSAPVPPSAASLRIDRSASAARRRRPGALPWIAAAVVTAVAVLAAKSFWDRAAGHLGGVSVREGLVQRFSAAAAAERTTASGYVTARVKAAISSREPGKLVRLLVDVGDRVEAGQLLAELEHAELDAMVERWRAEEARARADLDAAGAAGRERAAALERSRRETAALRAAHREAAAWLDEARREAARQEELLRTAASTVADRDRAATEARLAEARLERSAAVVETAVAEEARAARDAETFAARVESARAALASIEASLREGIARREDSFIRAPFAGVVLRKEADVGEVIAPVTRSGSTTRGAVVTLADFSTLEMEVDVFERDVSLVEQGAPCRIVLDAYPDAPYPGRARQVVPTADRQKATVQVKVAFDRVDGRVLPEMGGKVIFLRAGAEADSGPDEVRVPAEALAERGGRRGVFLVEREPDGARVRFAPVETRGAPAGGVATVASGLAGGERVVLAPPPSLADGARVTVGP